MQDFFRKIRFPRSPWSTASLLAIAGSLGGLSIAFPIFWPVIFFILIPAYDLIYRADLSTKATFFLGWLFGFCLLGVSDYWVYNAYPLDWAWVSDPVRGLLITAVAWLVITATISFFAALWTLSARFILRRRPEDLLMVPILWVAFEWLRMWGFMAVTWGSGSVLTPFFSFGMLGYALANSSALLQVARLGGVYALSLLVAFVGFLLWTLFGREPRILSRRSAAILLIIFLVAYLILIFVPYAPPRSSLNVATIETDFPAAPMVSNETLDAQIGTIETDLATLAKSSDPPDVIVLPEDMRFLDTLESRGEDPGVYLQSLFGTHEVLLIDSGRTDGFLGTYGRIQFFSSTRGLIATRDKYLVIPFGEYIPYAFEWGLRAVGMGQALANDEANRDYLPGDPPQGVSYHGATLVVMLCSEMISPSLYRDTALGTTNPILINLSSQSDFHHGDNPFEELRDMMLVQSAWSDAPYFQSTNGAPDVRIAS